MQVELLKIIAIAQKRVFPGTEEKASNGPY